MAGGNHFSEIFVSVMSHLPSLSKLADCLPLSDLNSASNSLSPSLDHFTFFADVNCLANASLTAAGTSDSFTFWPDAENAIISAATGMIIRFIVIVFSMQVNAG